jgi:hypothetical protein
MDSNIKNDKQIYFNQVKGTITELNSSDDFCSITLEVGHENTRNVNLNMKKFQFDKIEKDLDLGSKIVARFYIVSRKKNDRWYTSANLLDIQKV